MRFLSTESLSDAFRRMKTRFLGNSTDESWESLSCLCGLTQAQCEVSFRTFKVLRCLGCGLCRTYPPPKLNYEEPIYPLPKKPDKEFLLRNIPIHSHLLDRISTIKQGGKMLDVGCGNGLLIKLAQERGYECVGVELDRDAVEFGRKFFKINVIHGDIFKVDFRREAFDIIVLSHILEHVFDPNGLLTKLHGLLSDEGYLIVSCPNFSGFARRVFRSRWAYRPEQHVWQFDPNTLCSILIKNNFRPVSIEISNMDYGQYQPASLIWDIQRRGRTMLGALFRMVFVPFLFLIRKARLGDNLTVISRKVTAFQKHPTTYTL